MTTYISTGGLDQFDCIGAAHKLNEMGFSDIEISAGRYCEDIRGNLKSIKQQGIQLTLHNYIPLRKTPFVLNLASADEEVANLSFDHVKHCLEISNDIEAKYYAVHAGFLMNPQVSELGQKLKYLPLQDRYRSEKIFQDRINLLSELSRQYGVKLLIENNVISQGNYDLFGENPLLMCSAADITDCFQGISDDVGLLLDVGHLNVSARTLRNDPNKELESLEHLISGLHLSDNDGTRDSNGAFSKSSWFMKYPINYDYTVIEVYDYEAKILDNLYSIVEESNK